MSSNQPPRAAKQRCYFVSQMSNDQHKELMNRINRLEHDQGVVISGIIDRLGEIRILLDKQKK